MIIKRRSESPELKLLRNLNCRMKRSEKELNYYINLEKGFAGELQFDKWLKNLTIECLILNDLIFEINNTTCQIDSIIIVQDTLYLFEIKNYDGDFYIDDDKWYTIAGKEIKNPLLQLKRSESMIRRLLQDHNYNFQIEAYVIFINPHFHLYQTPLNLPIIFPTQLQRFFNKLNIRSSKIMSKEKKLAKQLVSIHLEESPYTRLKKYTYTQLKRGIICASCYSFTTTVNKLKVECTCGYKEDITYAVLRSLEEYILLFPNKKITTSNIHEWINIVPSKKTIRRILLAHCKLKRNGKYSYYLYNPEIDSNRKSSEMDE